MPDATSITEAHSCRPLWIPDGIDLDDLPESFRVAIAEILNPAYERFVVEADGDPLERATGLTFVHTLWLELLDMTDIGHSLGNRLARVQSTDGCEEKIDRHLRLVGAKHRFGKFLHQLRVYREKAAMEKASD